MQFHPNWIQQKINLHKVDLVALAVLLIACIKFVHDLETSIDIGLFDETGYLGRGAELIRLGLPPAQDSPLYAIWYYILSLAQSNRVGLYFLNYRLMTIVPPLLAYIVLRRNHVSARVSLVVSWFLLVFGGYAYIWPKVNHFTLSVILITFILASFPSKSHLRLSLIVSLGSLLASFVHPEFFLTFIMSLALLTLVLIINFKKLDKRSYVSMAVFGLTTVALMATIGVPANNNRSMIAFGQHFATNWVGWNGSLLNPMTDWQQIVAMNFGAAKSIEEAFLNNPAAFFRHVGMNLRGAPKAIYQAEFASFIPMDRFSELVAGLCLILLFGMYYSRARKNWPIHKKLLLLIGIFLIPEIISVIVIYPREHYLLIPSVLILLGITILIAGNQAEEPVDYKYLLLLGLFLVSITPYYAHPIKVKQPTLTNIYFMQSLNINKPVQMLEGAGGYCIYLNSNCSTVWSYDKNMGFQSFLIQERINFIFLDGTILTDPRYKNDPEWQDFLLHYDQFGFQQLGMPMTDTKLIIQSALLIR
jgi:hypothetical protein